MALWSDPVDLATADAAHHVRLTNLDATYQVLTFVRASTHYALLVRVTNDAATVLGAPIAIHTPIAGRTLVTKSAPETVPAIAVALGPTGSNTFTYTVVEQDGSNTYVTAHLIANDLSSNLSDAATFVGTGMSPATAYLSGNVLITVLAKTANVQFAVFNVQSTTITFRRQGTLVTYASNPAIPISLVKSDYRTALLYLAPSSYPAGYTLANAEAFDIDCTADAVVNGTANPLVTQFSGTAAELRVLPGTPPVFNNYEPVGVMDSTLTPLTYTPFVAGLDAQICTDGPVSSTHSLPTWDELMFGSPRLFVNSQDMEVDALVQMTPDGQVDDLWYLITDALVAPLSVNLPVDSRFEGLSVSSTTIDDMAVTKVGAYYLVAVAYLNGATPKFALTAYKDEASVYGYVQDNQLRVIQRPLPAPALLYPTTSLQPSEIGTGVTTPMAPTNLSASSVTYQDSLGRTFARVTFQWDAVTENTDGTALVDLAYYAVYLRTSAAGSAYQFIGNAPTASLLASTIAPGTPFYFTVYAVSKAGQTSLAAPEKLFTTAGDSTPPPVPSAPTVTSRLGTIRADWNGLGADGSAMPSDFAWTEVHASTTSNFTPSSSTLVDKIPAPGYAILANPTYSGTYYFRLVSVDTSGNKSNPSVQSFGVVSRISGPDLQANSITANQIAAGAIDGQVITGAIIQTAKPLSQGGQNNRILLDTTRFVAYDTSGTATVEILTSTGALTLTGPVLTSASITGSSISGGSITIGSGSSVFHADSNGLYLGSDTFASAPFRVTPAGVLTSSSGTFSGTVSGATITGGTIAIGTGNSIFKADSNGIYLGNATFASAPFRVTPAGVLTATGATLSGNITANALAASVTITTPSISGGSISGTTLSVGSRFSVDALGNLTATNATVSGTVTASSVSLDANNYWTASGFRTGGASVYMSYSGGALSVVGGSISGGSITIGSSFSVNASGVLTASGATISGSVTASSVSLDANNYWNTSTGFRAGGASSNYISLSGGILAINLTGSMVAGSISSTGLYSTGDIQAAGTASLSVAGSIYGSTNVYSYTASLGQRALYIESSTGSYRFGTVTSSRRYKTDIADLNLPVASLLTLPMRQFKYIKDVDALGEAAAPLRYGLIAEEVVDHDPALEWLIQRDEEGRPDYVNWAETMPQVLLHLVQTQHQEIQALQARVTALEGTLS